MIRGNETGLRAIEATDVARYYEWINDDETNQWRGLYHPASREEAEEWIREQRARHPDHLSLAIETKEGEHVGFIGLREICSRSRRAEIWVYIGAKDYWHRGIGHDAVQTFCDYAFSEMNLFRLWLECNPEFTAVVRCYQKAGFVEEGRLRKAYYRNGEFRDTCIMGLLREDCKNTGGKENG